MGRGEEKFIFYKGNKNVIRSVTLENPKRQLLSLVDIASKLLGHSNPTRFMKSFVDGNPSLEIEQYKFRGHGQRMTAVANGLAVCMMVMQSNTLKQEEIQEDFRSWIFQVFTGDLEIIQTIQEHLALTEDERTMHSAVLGPVAKMNIFYQIDTSYRPVVYLRCDPLTYEVFDVDQRDLLPACPRLGTDLKIGCSTNLQNRENTYRHNGVFVFFVSLQSTDDSNLLEKTLKERFQSQRSSTGTEYYDLRNLKKLFKE
jgi:hypothetical protein